MLLLEDPSAGLGSRLNDASFSGTGRPRERFLPSPAAPSGHILARRRIRRQLFVCVITLTVTPRWDVLAPAISWYVCHERSTVDRKPRHS